MPRAAARVTPSVEATRGPFAQAAEPAHDGDLATAHAASPHTVLVSRRRARARTSTCVDARKLALTHAEAGHLELLRGGEAGDARADHNRMLLRAPAQPKRNQHRAALLAWRGTMHSGAMRARVRMRAPRGLIHSMLSVASNRFSTLHPRVVGCVPGTAAHPAAAGSPR
jgi:hypothetical protein